MGESHNLRTWWGVWFFRGVPGLREPEILFVFSITQRVLRYTILPIVSFDTNALEGNPGTRLVLQSVTHPRVLQLYVIPVHRSIPVYRSIGQLYEIPTGSFKRQSLRRRRQKT